MSENISLFRPLHYFAVQEPVLLLSNRYYIRNVTLNGSTINLVAKDLDNAVALDFDWLERRIYWSDVTSTGSNISRMFENGTQREVTCFVSLSFCYIIVDI